MIKVLKCTHACIHTHARSCLYRSIQTHTPMCYRQIMKLGIYFVGIVWSFQNLQALCEFSAVSWTFYVCGTEPLCDEALGRRAIV